MIVYVAGPYSKGDVAVNIRKAIDRGMMINSLGHYAVVPHLTHFMHMIHPHPYEYWMELDERILIKCDCLFRIIGESSGADKEEILAKAMGIPVVHTMERLQELEVSK